MLNRRPVGLNGRRAPLTAATEPAIHAVRRRIVLSLIVTPIAD